MTVEAIKAKSPILQNTKLKLPESRVVRPKDMVDDKTQKVGYIEHSLNVSYVDSFTVWPLFFYVFSLCCAYVAMSSILARKFESVFMIKTVPLMIIWIVVVLLLRFMLVRAPARKGILYTNNLTSKLVVFTQGWYLIPFWYSREPDVIDFQKHELISCSRKDKTETRFMSQDGFEMIAEWDLLFSQRPGSEPLSHSLNYTREELREWTKAVVIGRLSDLGGLNSYKDMLAFKNDVAAYVALIFGGEGTISEYEETTGTSMKNPVLKNLDLSDEAKKVFSTKSRVDVIAAGTKRLIKAGISAKEAAIIASTAEGAATREIKTYEGIPEGATLVALGDSGVAVANKGGKQHA